MDKHFYIISQLPTLAFDKENAMTIESFLQEAKKWMRRCEFKFLSKVKLFDTIPHKKDPRMWRQFKQYEIHLRQDLAQWRKSRAEGREIKSADGVFSIAKEGNPLDVELYLLKYRWTFIEELEKVHHFDLEFLILYFLKLQILRRLNMFDKAKGFEVYQSVIDSDYQPESNSGGQEAQARDQAVNNQ
jgi:hypothetical protein